MRTRIGNWIGSALIAQVALVGVAIGAHAQNKPPLTDIEVPPGYEEGYVGQLSEAEVKGIEEFAKNSYGDLQELRDRVAMIADYWTKKTELLTGIDDIIKKSKKLDPELLMRNVLERAVIIVKLIDKEVDMDSMRKGVVDQEVRLMKESILLAMGYWEPYLKHVNGVALEANVDLTKMDYKGFGLKYASLLWSVANSIFDASAEYKVRIETLKLLKWDLERDENKFESRQAGAIVRLNKAVKSFPDTSTWSDDQYVERIKIVRIDYNEALERLGLSLPSSGPNAPGTTRTGGANGDKAYSYDVEAYKLAIGYSGNGCSTSVSDEWAKVVARGSLQGTLDVNAFFAVRSQACSSQVAVQVATEVKAGKMNLAAWLRAYGYSGGCSISVGDVRASQVARMVASNEIAVEDFIEIFKRTCNSLTAIEVAGRH